MSRNKNRGAQDSLSPAADSAAAGSAAAGSAARTTSNEWVALILLVILFVIALSEVLLYSDLSSPAAAVNSFLSLTVLLFTVILYVCCMSGRRGDSKEKILFETLIMTMFFVSLVQTFVSCAEGNGEWRSVIFVLYSLLYLFFSFYWTVFWFYQRNKYPSGIIRRITEKLLIVVLVSYVAVVVVNFFTGFAFSVDESGNYFVEGSLLSMLSMTWYILYYLNIAFSHADRRTKWSLYSYVLLPFAVSILSYFSLDHPFFWGILGSLFAMAYLIPLFLIFHNIYVEREQRLLEKEKELTETKANAMALQINPHFISNTLASIAALCETDPAQATELTTRFAEYLRSNYTDMTGEELIPFAKELEHLDNYLSIEQVRFPELRVEYDIREQSFSLPSLTVQPLVENAVKHGIQKKKGSAGTITISSFRTPKGYTVRITDDGVGFDIVPNDGKAHVGIKNARTRLEMLCGGTLTVNGEPGKGTVSEVCIPDKTT